MGGGLFVNEGNVILSEVAFNHNRAIGGNRKRVAKQQQLEQYTVNSRIVEKDQSFRVNRGATSEINGISFNDLANNLKAKEIEIDSSSNKYDINRGAVAGVNGIGVNGIGSIVFGGGGGSGGFGGFGGIAGKPGTGGKSLFGGSDGGVGYGGSGAGLGGGIFIRSGQLILAKTTFTDNQAIGGKGINPAQGKGGAIFVTTKTLAQQTNIDRPPLVSSLGRDLEVMMGMVGL